MGFEASNIVDGQLYIRQDNDWIAIGQIQDCTTTSVIQDYVTKKEVEEIVERILARKALQEDSLIYDLEKRIKEINDTNGTVEVCNPGVG